MASTAVARRGQRSGRQVPIWRPSERLAFGVLGFVAILGLWEVVSRLGLVKQAVISRPSAIFSVALADITSGAIWPHLGVSGLEFVLGFLVAMLVGVPLGLAIGTFRRLNYLLDPWLSAIYATPTIALVPLIVIILGIGVETKVFVVFLEAIFVVTVSAMAGVRAADAVYHDVAQSFAASNSFRFRTVILPASVPFILTGARLGTGRALVGVVIAEFLASNGGIGFYIQLHGSLLQSARVYFGIILLGVLGSLLGEAVRTLERRVERWRPAID